MTRNVSEWHVGTDVYFSRKEALLAANGDVDKIVFKQYGLEAFDQIDWSVEPSQDWADMLAIRAQQIRDKYTYVRLWLSGGCDSHTMVKAFIDNKIWPNEIACVRFSVTNDMMGTINKETNNGAIPYMKAIKNTIPAYVKFRIYDFAACYMKQFYEEAYCGQDLRMSDVAHGLRPSMERWPVAWKWMLDQNIDNVGDIAGYDKVKPGYWPKGKDNDKRPGWVISVSDSDWTEHGSYDDVWSTEPFFTTPDYPELHCKQAHLVKNWFKSVCGTSIGDYNIPRYEDLTSETSLGFYRELKHGVPGPTLRAMTNAFYSSIRHIDMAQTVTVGKTIDEKGIRIHDRTFRRENPGNKIIQLYDKIISSHHKKEFKFNGLYGNDLGPYIFVKDYYLGN